MTALLHETEIEVERIGTRATVPNNDIARLMYYMKCVCIAIDCNHDPDIQRITNYHNWNYLSIDEQKALIVGCYTFSPDILHDKVFFLNDALCGNCLNEFYTISQVQHQFLAVESIVIAGQTRRVNKIMAYKLLWIKTYYFDPMERLTSRLVVTSDRTAPIYRQTYTAVMIRQPFQQQTSTNYNSNKICAVIIGVVIALIVVIIIVVTLFVV